MSGTDGSEVPRDDIVKGYELGGGPVRHGRATTSWRRSMPEAQRTIDLEEFVDLDEIDPVFYDSAYYLVPEKAAVKPYALLADGDGAVGEGRRSPAS